MKKVITYLAVLAVMIIFDLIYLFVYVDSKSFVLEPFVVFLGIEAFIVVFIGKLKSFLDK